MVNKVLGVQEDQRLEEVVPLTEEDEDAESDPWAFRSKGRIIVMKISAPDYRASPFLVVRPP